MDFLWKEVSQGREREGRKEREEEPWRRHHLCYLANFAKSCFVLNVEAAILETLNSAIGILRSPKMSQIPTNAITFKKQAAKFIFCAKLRFLDKFNDFEYFFVFR